MTTPTPPTPAADPDRQELAHRVRDAVAELTAITSAAVSVGCRTIDDAAPDEVCSPDAPYVATATTRRRSEFASGRCLLRELTGIGDDVAIPIGPHGAPVLPGGWTASLSHSEDLVVAVASDDPAVVALGVDVQHPAELDDDERAIVLRPDDDAPDALTAFARKEAVYKAWSVLGGRLLDHHDVRSRGLTPPRFGARVLVDGTEFTGSETVVAGIRLALVVVVA